MTKAEVQALIDSNLASASTITAVKHREVETALLNFMDDFNSFKPLAKGTLTMGNLTTTTASFTATFATALSSADYIICGTIISAGVGQNDNEVQYAIGNKTVNGFTIFIRETAAVTQNVNFDYVIFAR
jgi:hypothetical protein